MLALEEGDLLELAELVGNLDQRTTGQLVALA